MRVVQINAVSYGSTGRIMFQLADYLENRGDSVLCTAGFTWAKCSRDDFFLTSNIFEKTIHTYMARLTGRIGGFSTGATRRLIKKLEEFSPDVIHLHNLHGWFLNLPMLFGYIRKKGIKVVWTLHDCWAFTGHCPHFDMIRCQKWKTGCHSCPLYREYPQCWFDRSRTMYRLKKEWFSGVKDLTVVTPSRWLAQQVEQSFLGAYPVRVIHNSVDTGVFRPDAGTAAEKYGLAGAHVVLGVAYDWDRKKGLDVFEALSRRLGEEYKIVLVGTNENVDAHLPKNIVSVHRTRDQKELAQLYSAASVFVNPTREDTFPTVNMEALACGTPVVTFRTGGSPEIPDESCGIAVDRDDIDALEEAIRHVCRSKPFSRESCRLRAKAFSPERFCDAYSEIYRSTP